MPHLGQTLSCQRCGGEFVRRHGRQLFCGSECCRLEENAKRRAIAAGKPLLRQHKEIGRVKIEFGAELDAKEVEILRWIGLGKSDDMIAEIMHLSLVTVRRWTCDAKIKLGAESRAHAIALILRADHEAAIANLRAQLHLEPA